MCIVCRLPHNLSNVVYFNIGPPFPMLAENSSLTANVRIPNREFHKLLDMLDVPRRMCEAWFRRTTLCGACSTSGHQQNGGRRSSLPHFATRCLEVAAMPGRHYGCWPGIGPISRLCLTRCASHMTASIIASLVLGQPRVVYCLRLVWSWAGIIDGDPT